MILGPMISAEFDDEYAYDSENIYSDEYLYTEYDEGYEDGYDDALYDMGMYR